MDDNVLELLDMPTDPKWAGQIRKVISEFGQSQDMQAKLPNSLHQSDPQIATTEMTHIKCWRSSTRRKRCIVPSYVLNSYSLNRNSQQKIFTWIADRSQLAEFIREWVIPAKAYQVPSHLSLMVSIDSP
jgi:hypothetical protein